MAAVGLVGGLAVAQNRSDPVRDIGSRRQLLVDDHVIASLSSLKRSFHPARKHGPPVIVPEHPWEGVGTAEWPSAYLFGDVIRDDDKKVYRMWYTSATSDAQGQHLVLYATSKDGIRWRKPMDLGIVKYKGSGANNILLRKCSAENVLELKGCPDPAKRFRLFTYDRNVNAYAWRHSADGLHWGKPVVVGALRGMYDMANVAYDETRGTYVLAVKHGHSPRYRHPVLGKHPKVAFRRWYMATSTDGLKWTPRVDLLGDFDALDKALYLDGERCAMLNTYGISLHAYHGLYLGIQWLFRITDTAGYWGCHGGPMDGRLIVSRDPAGPWRIPTREFILPRGRKGQWDWGMICGVANRPVLSPDGDEWWYYYGGWDGGHGTSRRRACIGLARFRLDGFASIDSFGTAGVLTTTRLTFAGKHSARVELLDAAGRALKGYSKDDGDPIHADSVNHTVTWKGRGDVSKLAGRVVRVKVHLKGAELYAFQFVE